MAAIPTILKGDQPEPIAISLAEGFDYGEATLHVKFKGIEKTFTGLSGGSTLQLALTSEDTARMCLGAAAVGMWLVYPGGRIRTIPSDDVRIKVTDSPAEVYNAPIALRPATLPPDATESDTLGDLKAKYNALKATLAAGCAALCVLVSSAAGISGGPLNDIPGNATVVTNVTFDGLAKLEDLQDAGVSAEAVTNIVKAVAPKPEDYTTTNAVKDIVTDLEPIEFSEWTVTGWPSDATYKGTPYFKGWWEIDFLREDDDIPWLSTADTDDPNATHLIFSYGISASRTVLKYKNRLGLAMADDIPDVSGYVPATRLVAGKPLTSDVTLGPTDVGAASKDELGEIWNYMMAENFRVTVTNYDSTAHDPEASYEYRMSTNEPWRTVWTETNGLARTHTSATNDALKAAKDEIAKPENRAWGSYDSTTGTPAPEGIVQVSAEGGLLIGGGMGYTAVAATGGEYWVLTSTDPTLCRTGTNGVFEIVDSSGNAAVTVRKGDKRLVPAPSDGISTTADAITIVYRIESAEHPTLECSASLTGGGWLEAGSDGAAFGSVTWTGGSGEWVATIPSGGNSSGFFRASYWTGGGTVVSYGAAAIEMPKIKIGNVEYTVGTATISGHTVLTLEARP